MSEEHNPVDLDANQARDEQDHLVEVKAKRDEFEDWTWLMSDARGRSILWRILEQAGVYRTTFAVEPTLTAFNEGKRSLGLQSLATAMEHAPQQFFIMSQEAKAL